MLFILYQPRRKPSLQIKKYLFSIDDHIASLLVLVKSIGTNRAEVLWDDYSFGRNTDIPLYIYMRDVLVSKDGNQDLKYNYRSIICHVSIFHLYLNLFYYIKLLSIL